MLTIPSAEAALTSVVLLGIQLVSLCQYRTFHCFMWSVPRQYYIFFCFIKSLSLCTKYQAPVKFSPTNRVSKKWRIEKKLVPYFVQLNFIMFPPEPHNMECSRFPLASYGEHPNSEETRLLRTSSLCLCWNAAQYWVHKYCNPANTQSEDDMLSVLEMSPTGSP